MSKLETELALRAAAGLDEGASAVLADFYERDGQLSRAALWRDRDRARRTLFATPPDFLVESVKGPRRRLNATVDPRRNVMLWLLYGVIYGRRGKDRYYVDLKQARLEADVVAEYFGLSRSTIHQVVTERDRMIWESARRERATPTLRATQRLIAAGALRIPQVTVALTPGTPMTIDAAGNLVAVADMPDDGELVISIGTATSPTTMTLGLVGGELKSAIDIPPDTWPRTGTVGILGPKKIRLPDRPRLSDPLL